MGKGKRNTNINLEQRNYLLRRFIYRGFSDRGGEGAAGDEADIPRNQISDRIWTELWSNMVVRAFYIVQRHTRLVWFHHRLSGSAKRAKMRIMARPNSPDMGPKHIRIIRLGIKSILFFVYKLNLRSLKLNRP